MNQHVCVLFREAEPQQLMAQRKCHHQKEELHFIPTSYIEKTLSHWPAFMGLVQATRKQECSGLLK